MQLNTSTVGYALKTSSGNADAVTIAVDNGGTATAGTATLTGSTGLTVSGIENVTITEADWTAITVTDITDVLSNTTGSNLAFKASGASNLTLGAITVTSGYATGTDTFDFSGQTGTLSATLTDTANNVTWTGGSGVETINTGSVAAGQTHTFNLGNAANLVTVSAIAAAAGTLTVTGGTADDTFYFAAANAGTALAINIDGGTSTSTSQNAIVLNATGAVTDTIDSMAHIQKITFQNTGGTLQTLNATVANGYADTVAVTFVPTGTAVLNINATSGGSASLANYTVLGTGTLTLTGSGGSTLTGAPTATLFVSGVGADVMTGGAGVDSYLITLANSNSTAGIDTISNFVAGTDILRLPVAGAGTVRDPEITNIPI